MTTATIEARETRSEAPRGRATFLRRSGRLVASAAVATALLGAAPATAGERSLLSSLPTLPAPRDRTDPPKDYGVPGLAVKEHTSAARTYLELTAAGSQGYCIVDQSGLRLKTWTTETENDSTELWRLVEKDGSATFERTRYVVASYLASAWVKSKTSIALREITKANGVTVWGYRDASGDVVLLARGVTSGREVRPAKPEEGLGIDFVASECGFGAARLGIGAAKNGVLAQLRGKLPPVGEGKAKVVPQFVVDGTLAKLARDPEPVLSVRVRLME
ncbi:MAG: hypothetical protein KF764_08000 [Labilithrix sp.]|nr:hypothetical protein [Labilithrix sp.]